MDTIRGFLAQVFVWDDWVVDLARTGILVVVGWVWARLGGWSVWRKPLFWVGSFVAVFVLLGIVGSTSQAERQVPGFRLELVNLVTVAGEEEHENSTLFLARVALTNTGPPSVVTNWHVYLTLPQRPERRISVHTADSLQIGSKVFTRDSLLYNHTRNVPVSRGERVVGYLPAFAWGVPEQHATQPGSSLRILAGDIYGNTYEVDRAFEPPFSQ